MTTASTGPSTTTLMLLPIGYQAGWNLPPATIKKHKLIETVAYFCFSLLAGYAADYIKNDQMNFSPLWQRALVSAFHIVVLNLFALAVRKNFKIN